MFRVFIFQLGLRAGQRTVAVSREVERVEYNQLGWRVQGGASGVVLGAGQGCS